MKYIKFKTSDNPEKQFYLANTNKIGIAKKEQCEKQAIPACTLFKDHAQGFRTQKSIDSTLNRLIKKYPTITFFIV